MKTELSIIIPAKNEAESLVSLFPVLYGIYPDAVFTIVDSGLWDVL